MMISTRGRYALRVMLDLAMHASNGLTPMRDVAQRQQISLKYLEQILPTLTRAGLIAGQHGRGGGYRLCRAPEEYRISEVLRLTEGSLAPVACLQQGAPCDRSACCLARPLWQNLDTVIQSYLDRVTLADLLTGQIPPPTL